VEGELTRVLSPDEVMGGTVCAKEVNVNNRTSEKPNARQGINRTCCCFNYELLLE